MNRYYRRYDGLVSQEEDVIYTAEWTPVVVIDPEDREDVERLAAAYTKASEFPPSPSLSTERVGNLQAALREMVKPEPPKCTAAISLDGIEFKRCEADQHDESRPHRCGGYTWTGGGSA